MADISSSDPAILTLLAGLLTCKETAQQLDKSERTVKRYRRSGLLEVVRIGKTDYYDIEKSRARLRGERPVPEVRRGRPRKR
jgi:hypothetical protein